MLYVDNIVSQKWLLYYKLKILWETTLLPKHWVLSFPSVILFFVVFFVCLFVYCIFFLRGLKKTDPEIHVVRAHQKRFNSGESTVCRSSVGRKRRAVNIQVDLCWHKEASETPKTSSGKLPRRWKDGIFKRFGPIWRWVRSRTRWKRIVDSGEANMRKFGQ